MTYADIDYFMIRLRSAVLVYLLLGGMITSLDPSLLSIPYIAIIIWAIFRYVRCAYITERFVEYATFTLWNMINFCSMLVFASISLTFHHSFGFTAKQSIFVASLPTILTLALYVIFALGCKPGNAFKIVGRRVEVTEPAPINKQDALVIVVICIALTPLIIRYPSPHAIATWFAYGANIFIIYQNREKISGFRKLRAHESSTKTQLLFENMEQIHNLRRSSLTGRIMQKLFM